jgi:cytochrome c-type biogenesis protein CcmH/NrfG
LRIDPRYASGWVRLGDRLRARGEHPEALAAYRRAAELGLDRRPRTAHRSDRSRN